MIVLNGKLLFDKNAGIELYFITLFRIYLRLNVENRNGANFSPFAQQKHAYYSLQVPMIRLSNLRSLCVLEEYWGCSFDVDHQHLPM